MAAAIRCRERRQELSLLIVEPNVYDMHADPHAELASHQMRRALGKRMRSARSGQRHAGVAVAIGARRPSFRIANAGRRWPWPQNAIAELAKFVAPQSEPSSELATTLSIGVATASVVPKNFDPMRMIESAAALPVGRPRVRHQRGEEH